MFSGSWSPCALQKLTTISLVLSIFSDRLLTLHHGRIVGALDDVVQVMQCCAVMGQECEQQWTEHTALRWPCAHCGDAGGVISIQNV